MTALIATAIIATSLATAFLSSIFGMLGGVVLMALLASLLPIATAMVLHGLIQLASNGYRGFLNRGDIQWRIIGIFSIGAVVALLVLAAIAWIPDRATVFLLLGILPYIAVAMPQNMALHITRPAIALVAGFVVVLVNLLAGVGGPLLDVFFQRVDLTRHQVVATKAIAQSLGHATKIIYFGGVLFAQTADYLPPLWLLIACLLTTIIGTRLGKRILDKMQDATFFRWTQTILLILGAILIIRALMEWFG